VPDLLSNLQQVWDSADAILDHSGNFFIHISAAVQNQNHHHKSLVEDWGFELLPQEINLSGSNKSSLGALWELVAVAGI
jgi:hypothetical protein